MFMRYDNSNERLRERKMHTVKFYVYEDFSSADCIFIPNEKFKLDSLSDAIKSRSTL